MDKKPLVLIIDDEEDIRTMVKLKLQANGFDVREAGDGIEGFDLAKETKPNLILLDLVMPTLNGVETLSRLKTEDSTKDIKVFLFTGKGDPRPDINEASKQFAIQNGAVDFIRKETDLNEIVNILKKAIGINA